MNIRALTHILLVDDSEDDNFFHERAIERSGIASCTSVCRDGVEAVEFLQRCARGDKDLALPAVIFLDINMPRMTGWEFVDAYAQFPAALLKKITVIMLSASMDQRDRERADSSPYVNGFVSKPLTPDKMRDIARDFLNYDGTK